MASTVDWASSPSSPAARAKIEVATPPGTDGVDPDPLLAELVGRRAGQVGDGRLAGAVVVAAVVGGQGGHTRGVDDAAAALGPHHPGGGPDAEEHPPQVDGHRPVEHRHVDLFDPAHRAGVAGVVEHAVQPAELVHGERHDGVDVGLLGDIGVEEAGLARRTPRRSDRRGRRRRRPGPPRRPRRRRAGPSPPRCHWRPRLSRPGAHRVGPWSLQSIDGPGAWWHPPGRPSTETTRRRPVPEATCASPSSRVMLVRKARSAETVR